MDDQKELGPSKGYQKQIKQEDKEPRPQPKANVKVDYSSPTAKKWPILLEALEQGDLPTVTKIIEEGINVNLIRDGVTPLMIASSKGHREIAETILQAGVNINEKTEDGWTALHKAAFDQQGTAIVDFLMRSGIDIDAKNKSGKTALNLAEEQGHRDIVRVIKKHQTQLGIDAQEWEDFLNSPEGKPYKQQKLYEVLTLYSRFLWLPPLVLGGVGLLLGYVLGVVVLSLFIGILAGLIADFVYYYFETSIRKYLDDIGPLPELDIHSLRLKRKAGEPILIKKKEEPLSVEAPVVSGPVDLGILPSTEGESESTVELESNDTKTPSLEVRGNRALVTVIIVALFILILSIVAFNYREPLSKMYFTKMLERRGFPLTEEAFLAEVSKNNEQTVDLFIKAGINKDAANEKGQTALMVASEKGLTNLLEKLIKTQGVALNRFDRSGKTALMTAVRGGREQAVKILVENRADINFMVKSADGAATALQEAVDVPDFKEEHLRILQYLIEKGANVNGKNSRGQSPLLFAVDHGRTEAAKELIEHGAEVNDTDAKGNFPLMIAACKGYPFLATLLVEKGANTDLASPDGNTPLMCAAREGSADTVNVLLAKGANVNAKNSSGSTALTEATDTGNPEIAKLLLQRGAAPGTGSLPTAFVSLRGKRISITAKRKKMKDLLARIAKAASQDGYAIKAESIMDRKSRIAAKASWNEVLIAFAGKNHLLLVVKDKEVFVLPYEK
jgi:ankyrin repeat protein